ncbi:MAG: lamin tail domain-containing protein [Deltaproteobacteria bacterium]|nr:lamin tail domain-containing protein [Deltaproteobacteria bacterium]
MHPERNWYGLAFCLLAAVCLSGCPGSGNGDGCDANLLAGDLVITEIMADPAGKDEGKEWFEIYNATSKSLSLRGVRLVASRADGSGEYEHVMKAAQIEPGQYFVLGGVLEDVKPGWIDYAYGADLSSLRNTGGRISVECGSNVVDRVVYEDSQEGRSAVFDGSQVPDAAANDNLDNWCESETEYAEDSFGTPGVVNEACEGTLPPTRCMDGENERAVVPPNPGDVVISEFMADPEAADDAVGEWFEIYFAANCDLNGLELGKTPGTVVNTVSSRDCIPVAAGSYLVFAVNADSNTNGGLPDVAWEVDISLSNAGGEIFASYGGNLLDHITYSGCTKAASTGLDPTMMDPTQNDDAANWCAATAAYGAGDLGSPGAANPSCGIVPPGKCYEGETLRDKVPPLPGEIVINELMPNPAGTDDDQEWFEILVLADHAVDLGDLEIGRIPPDVIDSLAPGECLPVAAGSYVVIAQNGEIMENGGIPQVDFVAPLLTLRNSGDEMGLFVGLDGELLDAMTYTSAPNAQSLGLDPDYATPGQNDDPALWCEGGEQYGAGGSGTPGAANPTCNIIPPGQCRDGAAFRDKVAPVEGDLVFSEIMPAPSVNDAVGEWFELYVGRDVDLNGLEIGRTQAELVLPEGDCIRVAAGSYVLFAKSDVAGENGGMDNVDYTFSFGLTNSGGSLYAGLEGTPLDTASYVQAQVSGGVAISLDPDFLTPAGNDVADNWCDAQDAYGLGDLGTPGAENPQCP